MATDGCGNSPEWVWSWYGYSFWEENMPIDRNAYVNSEFPVTLATLGLEQNAHLSVKIKYFVIA